MKNQDPGPYAGLGPRGFATPPDRLTGQVCDALRTNGFVDASEIDVEVRPESEEAILTGSVPTSRQRRLAEECVVSLPGIEAVHNRLMAEESGDEARGRGPATDPS